MRVCVYVCFYVLVCLCVRLCVCLCEREFECVCACVSLSHTHLTLSLVCPLSISLLLSPPPLMYREKLRERKAMQKGLNDERLAFEEKAQKRQIANLIRSHKVEVRFLV